MPKLLIYNTHGRSRLSCGYDCYMGVFPNCNCICRGINHGVGYEEALKNTLLIFDDLKAYDKNYKLSLHSKRQLAKLKQLKFKF